MTAPPIYLPTETRPKTVKPSFSNILSFPFRLCNPPPSVGKVRSFSVTPLVDVRLQDVLDRKHLPPLGLKDFEEWLLYVERAPENLYFTLWLREYTVKYNQWAASYKAQRDKSGGRRVNWSVPSSSHLAMFYARAKQTFFMPNSAYELNLPSKFLAPFHASDGSLHPDPLIFTDIALETQKMLQQSLRFFVQAQLNNVGNSRVICGIIAGILAILVLAVLPLSLVGGLHEDRWLRLVAFPGTFAGLIIIVAALHGVCMGIYLVGDLRQLHKFELNRPPISKPRPLSISHQGAALSSTLSSPSTGPILPITQPPRLSIVPPAPIYVPEHRRRHRDSGSSVGSQSSSSLSGSSDSTPGMAIEISNIMYDVDSVDGPATSPICPDAHSFPSQNADDGSFTTTATFIHPYEYSDDDHKVLPEEGQPLSSFDFDALPSRTVHRNPPPQYQYHRFSEIKAETSLPSPQQPFSLRHIIARVQEKCTSKWRLSPRVLVDAMDKEKQSPSRRSSTFGLHTPQPIEMPPRPLEQKVNLHQQWKMVKAVPAFTELTRILSPVIVRGQWEIVVRSTTIALVLSCALFAGLLAIPPQ